MCGICGALSLRDKSVPVEEAKPMVDRIAHRGPDDAGYLFVHTGARHDRNISFSLNMTDTTFKTVDGLLPAIESGPAQRELSCHDYDLFLGHRRLSILDTSQAGHQPMSDLSKNIWTVYNGEIYNFDTLRTELQKRGHRFRSQTDTEVIIYAYIEWGIDCVRRFNGMFALALYDNFQKKFYLIRDRYGVKPLYYYTSPRQTVFFASEIKSILAGGGYQGGIDARALVEYFTFQNIFTDRTLHRDIRLLEAGHYLTIDLAKQSINKTRYWDFDFSEPEHVHDEREYIEELNRLFTQAVKRQLVADVDVGSYLSGGMDSGSITAVAARHLPYIKTFTVGFDLSSASGIELNYDERAKSEYMSYLFKTEHYEMVLKSGDMERCLPDFAYALEEPRVGQSYPNYYAAKLAGRFVKVVLSGAGGDELFAGYPWRYYKAVNNSDFDDYVDKYYKYWKRLIPNKLVKQIFSPVAAETQDVWTRDIFADVLKTSAPRLTNSPEEYVNHSLYFEAKTFLHGLLVVEDKLSMAHSLETRVPFLDNDLVDFAQKVPVRLKLGNLDAVSKMDENEIAAMQRTNDGKRLLRQTMSRYIPEDIHQSVKQGFSSPDNSWFKGDSIDFVKNRLLQDSARIYRYMDRDTVQNLIREHLMGQHNRRLFVWSLLNVEEWCRLYD